MLMDAAVRFGDDVREITIKKGRGHDVRHNVNGCGLQHIGERGAAVTVMAGGYWRVSTIRDRMKWECGDCV